MEKDQPERKQVAKEGSSIMDPEVETAETSEDEDLDDEGLAQLRELERRSNEQNLRFQKMRLELLLSMARTLSILNEQSIARTRGFLPRPRKTYTGVQIVAMLNGGLGAGAAGRGEGIGLSEGGGAMASGDAPAGGVIAASGGAADKGVNAGIGGGGSSDAVVGATEGVGAGSGKGADSGKVADSGKGADSGKDADSGKGRLLSREEVKDMLRNTGNEL